MTRAERLGLESGSIMIGRSEGASVLDVEMAHSIAISLKRIADALSHAVREDGSIRVRKAS